MVGEGGELRAVGTVDEEAAGVAKLDEVGKDPAYRGEVVVNVEVIGFNIRDYLRTVGVLVEAGVALIGLEDYEITGPEAVVVTDVQCLAAEEYRRVATGVHENLAEHCGGGGLAVGAGYGDGALAGDE